MKQGDVILKVANAIDIMGKRTQIFIDHPEGSTNVVGLRAVFGRWV
jgi:hypothetical protein